MATEASLVTPLNEPHSPNQHGLQLFENCVATIRHELVKLRHHWDKHEPRMFARAQSISDQDLCRFNIKEDLVLIRAGKTTYGAVVFGKIKLPAIEDAEGEDQKTGHIKSYRAIMRREDPLNWFNE